jgi:hypothetical protein
MTYKYTPSPWQLKFHSSPARIKVVWAGRRAGKGRAVLTELMRAITQASTTPFLVDEEMAQNSNLAIGTDLTYSLEPAIHIWVVAPNFAQSRQAWNELQQFIPKDLVVRRKEGQGGGRGNGWKEDERSVWLRLKTPNIARRDVYIEIKSADDAESLQTAGPDFIWVTESQDIKEAAWNKLRPMLNSAGRLGKACVEGIPPFSRNHWFSKLFRWAESNPSDEYEAFTATTFDNIFLSERQRDAIRDEKATMPEQVWERMYLAKQPDGGAGFFRPSKINEAAVGKELWLPDSSQRYVAGLDLGKKQDFTVLIIKNARTRSSVYSLEMNGTDWVSQIETISSEIKRWNIGDIRIDSTGLGDVVFDHLLNSGLPVTPFKFSAQSKYQLFHNYYIALENNTVTFPGSWDTLRKQLEDISMRPGGNGSYLFYSETEEHDDWVDAELLSLMACDPPGYDNEEYDYLRPIRRMNPIRPHATRGPSKFMQMHRANKHKARLPVTEEESELVEVT